MKIGIVSNLYPPYARGGAEYVVVRTVESLTDTHNDVFVISTQPRKKKVNHDVTMDMGTSEHVYRFFPKNLYFTLDDHKHTKLVRFFWHVIDAFSGHGANVVRSVISEELPDVMITHNLKGIGLKIASAIQRKGIPHVHIVHDLQLIYPSGLLFAGREKTIFFIKPFYAVYRWICRRRMGDPDLVIFPSDYLKEEYLKLGFFKNSEVVMMPNPAPKFTPIERTVRTPGPLRLLFVGQLEVHKGIKFLLEEFQKLAIPAQLIIAGEGTYKKYVEKAAEKNKNVVYLGYISVDQLVSCFGMADALIVPSLCYENSPTVIYESLNAGVPVIASDIGGVGELVHDGDNGILFKAGSKSDFVRALWRLDEMKDEFVKNQEKIKETISGYKLELYTKKLIERIEKIISG